MKKLMSVCLVMVLAAALTGVSASKTGDTRAIHGITGPKFEVSPSDAVAEYLRAEIRDATNEINVPMHCIVKEPQILKEIGMAEIKAGDEIELIRLTEKTWKIKMGDKEITVEVKS